jgi:hypothetical protein
MKKPILGTS